MQLNDIVAHNLAKEIYIIITDQDCIGFHVEHLDSSVGKILELITDIFRDE